MAGPAREVVVTAPAATVGCVEEAADVGRPLVRVACVVGVLVRGRPVARGATPPASADAMGLLPLGVASAAVAAAALLLPIGG